PATARRPGAAVAPGPPATGPTAGLVTRRLLQREETPVVGERSASMCAWVNAVWLLIAIGMVGAVGGCHENTSNATASPPVVTVAKPVTQTVTDYLTFTGNTAPTQSVTLVARVEGYLEKNHFTDGSRIKKGDLLFTIQQDQYKAQL